MARIELRDTTIRVKDGLSGTASILESTPGAADTDVDITDPALNSADPRKVPIGARFTVSTAGNATKFIVTGRTLSTGVDEVQEVTVSGGTMGDVVLTFNLWGRDPVDVTVAYNETAANIEAAIDAAMAAAGFTDFVPGDISVAGDFGVGATTFTYDGTSVTAQNQGLMETDDSGTDATVGAVTETTKGVHVDQVTNIEFTPTWGTPTPAQSDTITFLPQEAEIKIGDGNITYTEAKDYEYELDRGELDTVRENDDQPLEATIDFVYEFVTTGTGEAVTPVDALKGKSGAAEWVTSAATDPCAPYAVDIEIEHAPDCGATEKEYTLFPEFRYDSLEFDLSEAAISTTGRCNVTEPTVWREAITT